MNLAAVAVPLPLPAKLGLPWLVLFLERAKSLPDVDLVHAVLSLCTLPSPALRLTPGLVNPSSDSTSQSYCHSLSDSLPQLLSTHFYHSSLPARLATSFAGHYKMKMHPRFECMQWYSTKPSAACVTTQV
jgi:hypothetical protein